jgi:hypothetical protein
MDNVQNCNSYILVSGLENREYSRRDPSSWPRDTLYLRKLALTSPTSCGRSVSIVRSRTKATELLYSCAGVRCESTWYVDHYLACRTNHGWYMLMCGALAEWMVEDAKYSEWTFPSVALSTTNTTWTDVGFVESQRLTAWSTARSVFLFSVWN